MENKFPQRKEGQEYRDSSTQASGRSGAEQLANGLGWFSIGLGLAEVAAPGMIRQLVGAETSQRGNAGTEQGDYGDKTIRAYGLREIGAGVAILSQPTSARWVWTRVAGDVLDLATLGSAMTAPDANRARLAAAMASVLGITALDIMCAQRLSRLEKHQGAQPNEPVRVKQRILVNRTPEEVYQFWRNLENLPRFMHHLESVQVTGQGRSHWKAKAPAGMTVEWEAQITDDRPNELLCWRSIEGSEIPNSGAVRFEKAPGGRGTLIQVDLEYSPPGGRMGAQVAKLFGREPSQQVEEDLRAFKKLMETGEIPQSDASIHTGMHPAQPSRQKPPQQPYEQSFQQRRHAGSH